MATATFPAQYVYDRSQARLALTEEERLAAREMRITEIMETAIHEGALWWKATRFPDRVEAEKIYESTRGMMYGSDRYWTEYTFKTRRNHVVPLMRIAAAAIAAGSESVSLTPEDCEWLDIPVGFRVPS